jgi:hypothetical protein
MVGGIVVEVIPATRGVWVNCEDRPSRGSKPQRRAIWVEHGEEVKRIAVGDALWWQSSWAFWTPAHEAREDVRINRIGYSGAVRPTGEDLVH